jgi:hypothetical protein
VKRIARGGARLALVCMDELTDLVCLVRHLASFTGAQQLDEMNCKVKDNMNLFYHYKTILFSFHCLSFISCLSCRSSIFSSKFSSYQWLPRIIGP